MIFAMIVLGIAVFMAAPTILIIIISCIGETLEEANRGLIPTGRIYYRGCDKCGKVTNVGEYYNSSDSFALCDSCRQSVRW